MISLKGNTVLDALGSVFPEKTWGRDSLIILSTVNFFYINCDR